MDNAGEKYCITEEDMKKGVTTIENKKDKDCPFFDRWDILYGGRQNINPASVLRSSLVVSSSIQDSHITHPLSEIIIDDDNNDDDGGTFLRTENVDEINSEASFEDIEIDTLQKELNTYHQVDLNINDLTTTSTSSFSQPVIASVPSSKKSKAKPEIVTKIEDVYRQGPDSADSSKGSKQSKSIHNSYAEFKKNEFILAERKFEHDKAVLEEERKYKKERLEIDKKEFDLKSKSQSNELKNASVLELIKQGKSKEEIREFLLSLKDLL